MIIVPKWVHPLSREIGGGIYGSLKQRHSGGIQVSSE
jgi:hypothetical protein